MNNNIEECVCGAKCRAVQYVGDNRIPLCSECADLIADSDIEWDRNITFKDLKARVILLKNIKKHDKVYRALVRGRKK